MNQLSLNEYYVVVFDVCSSSVILEELQKCNKLKVWRKFWTDVFHYANKIAGERGKCKVYKFVGDGFIFLYYPTKKNSLLEFCDNIMKFVNENLKRIITENCICPKRLGITIGIDRGTLIPMSLYGSKEYMGEAINVASRLQSQLKDVQDANSILVSQKVYDDIEETLSGRKVVVQNKVLHNLFKDKEVACYQIF